MKELFDYCFKKEKYIGKSIAAVLLIIVLWQVSTLGKEQEMRNLLKVVPDVRVSDGWIEAIDTDGGWVDEATLNKAVSLGIVGSTERAYLSEYAQRYEVVTMINTALGINQDLGLKFKDIKKNSPYFGEYSKAYYVSSYEDGTVRPEDYMTRAEMAVIVARVLQLEPDYSAIYTFVDEKDIPTWACYGIGSAVKAGFFEGYPDGSFRPNQEMTRAEVIKMIVNVKEAE